AKVTGAARYAADWQADGMVHAVLVTSAIPAGRVRRADIAAASGAPGVVAVYTHRNAARLKPVTAGVYPQHVLPLQDELVRYEGEPVAVVVAERLEQARHAAELLSIAYESAEFTIDMDAGTVRMPGPEAGFGRPADTSTGDVAA